MGRPPCLLKGKRGYQKKKIARLGDNPPCRGHPRGALGKTRPQRDNGPKRKGKHQKGWGGPNGEKETPTTGEKWAPKRKTPPKGAGGEDDANNGGKGPRGKNPRGARQPPGKTGPQQRGDNRPGGGIPGGRGGFWGDPNNGGINPGGGKKGGDGARGGKMPNNGDKGRGGKPPGARRLRRAPKGKWAAGGSPPGPFGQARGKRPPKRRKKGPPGKNPRGRGKPAEDDPKPPRGIKATGENPRGGPRGRKNGGKKAPQKTGIGGGRFGLFPEEGRQQRGKGKGQRDTPAHGGGLRGPKTGENFGRRGNPPGGEGAWKRETPKTPAKWAAAGETPRGPRRGVMFRPIHSRAKRNPKMNFFSIRLGVPQKIWGENKKI